MFFRKIGLVSSEKWKSENPKNQKPKHGSTVLYIAIVSLFNLQKL
jgi:hypothetical protein